jgi:hypothetical protein
VRRGRARAAAVALLAVSAICAPVAVAAARIAPVAGAGGFADAPFLRAGTYADMLLSRETLFYAVRLREGQRLTVHATVDLRPGSQTRHGASAFGGFGLRIYDPLRQALFLDSRLHTEPPNFETDEDAWRTPRVVSYARATRAAQHGEDWRGPGVYYVTAAVSAIFHDVGAIVELPLRLKVDIDDAGAPAGATADGPLDAPVDAVAPIAARARPAPAAPAPAGAAAHGPSPAAMFAAAGGGLLFGLLLAATIAVLARERTAAL